MVRVGKHLRFGPGVYFSYAVGGKATITTHDQNSPTTDRTVELTFDNPQTEEMIGFKKTDYGLLFSATYTLPHRTFVRAQFSKGLNDIMPDVPFQPKTETYKNWGFILSAGWYFVEL